MHIPAAIDITFFDAPPISTPIVSEFVYTLKYLFDNKSCILWAFFFDLHDTATAVGIFCATSSA